MEDESFHLHGGEGLGGFYSKGELSRKWSMVFGDADCKGMRRMVGKGGVFIAEGRSGFGRFHGLRRNPHQGNIAGMN